MAAVDDRVEIIERILTNEMKKTEVKVALAKLENEFGEKAYVDDGFLPKAKPWNKEYYSELEKISLTGVSSKKYIIHLVEVRDYLRFRLMITIVGIVAAIMIILGIIFILY